MPHPMDSWHGRQGIARAEAAGRRPPLVDELKAEEDAPVLPSMGRPSRKVWIVSEDPSARDARLRAQVAEEIARAIETHHAADDLTAIQSARVARYHAAPAVAVQETPTPPHPQIPQPPSMAPATPSGYTASGAT